MGERTEHPRDEITRWGLSVEVKNAGDGAHEDITF
jgi:hypothetical protein